MYQDLFGSFSGLLSLGIIIFVVLMAVYLLVKFIKLSSPESRGKGWE